MTSVQTEIKTTTQKMTQEPEVLYPIYAGQTHLEGINTEEGIQSQGMG